MRVLLVALALALAGCAGVPTAPDPSPFWADARFAPAIVPPGAGQVFALSPEMQEYLQSRLAVYVRRKGPRLGLVAAMREDLRIEYDTGLTRDAAQAFAARAGNCMSLVMLTAAFARQMGIPVVFQSVYGHDTWSRSGGIAFRSGHVNLVLGSRGLRHSPLGEPDEPMTVDFLPAIQARHLFTRPIDEAMLVAMYQNNRAAELLAAGQTRQAYWWARAATVSEPALTGAYNTLGVIYRRSGELARAEQVLRHALAREPANVQVLGTLAAVLKAQGNSTEARGLRQRLEKLRGEPPYVHFDRGLAALERGDDAGAVGEFRRELERMPYDDQLHYVLAMTLLRQGDVAAARRHLRRALETSTRRESRELYAARLRGL